MKNQVDLSPQERLAMSRQAIVRYMDSSDGTPAGQRAPVHRDAPSLDDGAGAASSRGAWYAIKRAVRSWWHHHPAQLALDVAKPVLSKYAEEKPYQLLGLAALAGAAVVLTRPWRLVSVTGLAGAAFKSSHMSGLLLSLLSSHSEPPPNENQH